MTQHYITTTSSTGQATFSPTVPSEPYKIPLKPNGSIEDGYIQILSWLETTPPNPTTETDLQSYAHIRTSGLTPGSVCPPHGASTLLMVLPSGQQGAPMHKTMTFDMCIILQGVAELVLDSGEARVLQVGDTVLQRATAHSWRNITPEGGVLKLLACVLAARERGGE